MTGSQKAIILWLPFLPSTTFPPPTPGELPSHRQSSTHLHTHAHATQPNKWVGRKVCLPRTGWSPFCFSVEPTEFRAWTSIFMRFPPLQFQYSRVKFHINHILHRCTHWGFKQLATFPGLQIIYMLSMTNRKFDFYGIIFVLHKISYFFVFQVP